MDQDDLDEQEALLDTYKRALGMTPDLTRVRAASESEPKQRRRAR